MKDIILKTENLFKTVTIGKENTNILNDVNLEVEKGEFISIMGPSGCGKSTLLYLLGGLDKPSEGNVILNNQDINKLSNSKKSRLRCSELGFVFQFYNLVPGLTVEENILLPVVMAREKRADVKEKLEELLKIVNLTDKKKLRPHQLSGGQQQRTAIARALITNPSVLLADEPIGNLDSVSGNEVMKLFKRINDEQKVTIIQVTHSNESAEYGNRIIRMRDGRIINHRDGVVTNE
ncbi:ABC transporter ATP-binding protein [Clostridium sp. CM028]|uniref:ABC transporter ATP-binding protein n=1 Tax=unclassified Clostridium TaxID=2614128 RepID=UPI001C0BF76C|nr:MULTISPECIES: ABC transporter ATP-binding protein [unclassified Clostridium]MBU3090549.1 ABC transporter ATP-binding protein [Clostridium sp. CF011]MBW9145949.1 ABC transporter ATP-binding protein [Clostridium sp. CM027]MBW9149636.1 ABC transporter ATP-binding protein [Clostridium sp. CM028]UVE40924.1 ABC transporter ATP-binding protein [Clostridium sp. CM027]WAG69909.1 ABC transporter ATP-binding protein [Clostridium sp. CF011]